MANLLRGIVVETNTTSLTGKVLYSDFCVNNGLFSVVDEQDPFLNQAARGLIVGMAAGVARAALAVIHTVGHLLAALVTCKEGHLYHAAKGGCEFLRGIIEAIPILGRIFANRYSGIPPSSPGVHYSWWIIKIYNPQSPDLLDSHADLWRGFKASRPDGYFIADRRTVPSEWF